MLSAGFYDVIDPGSWLNLPVSFSNMWVKMPFLIVLGAVYCELLELHFIFRFRTFPELDLLTGYSCRLHFHTRKHSLQTVKQITLSVALSSFFMVPLLWKEIRGLWFFPLLFYSLPWEDVAGNKKQNFCASGSWIIHPFRGNLCQG